MPFFAGAETAECSRYEGEKTGSVFLRCHLYIKMILLPRQARDKHRESTQKRGRFLAGRLQRQANKASLLGLGIGLFQGVSKNAACLGCHF